jgi:mycothiol synthase
VSEHAFDVSAAVAAEPGPAAVTWRVPERDDLPAWLEFIQRTQRFDGDEVVGAEELAASFEDGTWAPETDGRLLIAPDGSLVGDAVVATQGPGRDAVRFFCWGGVRPDWRGRGLGRQILDWQLRRGAEWYAELDTDLPGFLEVGCPVGAPTTRLLARYGFEPARYWSSMVHPLTDLDGRRAGQADGLQVTSYREELSEQVRRAHNEAFADHWGSREWDAPRWKELAVGHPTFRPELSFVVLDGTRRDPTVAAYVLAYENEGDPPVGYLGQVGTRRAWRGRGLAATLVCATLAAMKKAGYGHALLTVDDANPTGALDLYLRLGFEVERQRVTYRRAV